jgi:hypothetical protein
MEIGNKTRTPVSRRGKGKGEEGGARAQPTWGVAMLKMEVHNSYKLQINRGWIKTVSKVELDVKGRKLSSDSVSYNWRIIPV